MYAHRERTGPVELAFTDRLGGVSAAPYDELNLALLGEDDPAARERNLRLLLEDFAPDAALADMEQVHGDRVAQVGPHGAAAPGTEPGCDALVSDRADVVLMVRVADCVPVLLADAEAGVIGAAHAGRQGMARGVVPATVARMRELGAGGSLRAWLGPSICGGCYEVPAQLHAEVARVEPDAAATTTWGTPSLDVAAGVRAQLARVDVPVEEVGGCTREDPLLYSYRRDGVAAGRFAGLVRRHA